MWFWQLRLAFESRTSHHQYKQISIRMLQTFEKLTVVNILPGLRDWLFKKGYPILWILVFPCSIEILVIDSNSGVTGSISEDDLSITLIVLVSNNWGGDSLDDTFVISFSLTMCFQSEISFCQLTTHACSHTHTHTYAYSGKFRFLRWWRSSFLILIPERTSLGDLTRQKSTPKSETEPINDWPSTEC